MRRAATVVHIHTDASPDANSTASVVVALQGLSQCSRCAKGQGCGAGFVELDSGASSATGNLPHFNLNISAADAATVTLGQQVEIDIDTEMAGARWLWPVFGAYGLPLVGMLLATFVASLPTVSSGANPASNPSELSIIVSAGFGFCAGLLLWRLLSGRLLQWSESSLCLSTARIVTQLVPVQPNGFQPAGEPIQHRK